MASIQDAAAGASDDKAEQVHMSAEKKVTPAHLGASSQNVPEDESHGRVSTSPEIRYRVEYRSFPHGLLLMTKESTQDEKQLLVHKGPVFDVVDVNFTAETKDTRKDEQTVVDQESKEAVTSLTSSSPPSIQRRGRSYIRIYSRAIINALQSVVNYYPNQDLVSQPVDIRWPYAILIHHWDELKQFRQRFATSDLTGNATECSVPDTYKHMGLLLDFLEKKMGEKVREEQGRWRQTVPKASFEMLWLLLKPGIDVYEHIEEDDTKEPYVISSVEFNLIDQSWDNYSVDKWYLDNDSTSILPQEMNQKIVRFHGEKPIHELELFPCEYFQDHTTRKKEAIKRGQLFIYLQQKRCMYFEGQSWTTPRQSYKGYVMVDPVQALEDNPRDGEEDPPIIVDQKPSQLPLCSCGRCSTMDCERNRAAKFQGYKRIAFKDASSLTEHQFFLCPPCIWAFVLSIRQWKQLDLTDFREPEWNVALMDSLVLKEPTKRMLQNLCRLYINRNSASAGHKSLPPSDGRPRAKAWTADYVDDKGKGFVVLLHGKPGVGKTYTAECIAHTMKRPLLSITTADIGVDPPKVEPNLRRWFNIARLWDAVLLIDEADIYFESRQTQDLERNNLVASFLRAIEYYDGILFLTTNRVGTSDEAVWSRIHATIYYDNFTEDQRQKIWNTYFDKLEQERGEEVRILESAKEYVAENKEVKDLQWNGRQIRNAFQIAVNLAQAEDSRDAKGRFTVKRDHIKVTVDLLRDFGNYMHKVHTVSPSKNAELGKIRYDDFNAASEPDDAPI